LTGKDRHSRSSEMGRQIIRPIVWQYQLGPAADGSVDGLPNCAFALSRGQLYDLGHCTGQGYRSRQPSDVRDSQQLNPQG
jgi:hypothetical protein